MEKMTQKQFDTLYNRVVIKTLADHRDKHQPTNSDESNDPNDPSNLTKVIVGAAETSAVESIEYTNDLLKNVLQALFVQK